LTITQNTRRITSVTHESKIRTVTARGEMLRIYRSALPGDRFDHWRCVVGQWCPRICDRPFAGSYWSARCSRESTNSCSTLGTFGVWRLRTVSTFCQRYSRTGRKRRTESLKTCSSPRLFFSPHPEGSLLWHDRPDTPHTIINAPPRGPCAGDIDQPPLASSAVHREVPALTESTSHLSADRTTETVTVVAHGTRWHPPSSTRTPTSVALRPPLVLRPLGVLPPWCFAPLGASPPWCFAPLGLRLDVRLRPVTMFIPSILLVKGSHGAQRIYQRTIVSLTLTISSW
jgi:hypothetical protein